MTEERGLLVVILGATLLAVAGGVGSAQAPPPADKVEAEVQRACSTCHLVPSPDVLPREAWKPLVTQMAMLAMAGVGAPKGGPPAWMDVDIDAVARYFETRAPIALPSPQPWPLPGSDPERFKVRSIRGPAEGPEGPTVANVRLAALEPGGSLQIVASDMSAGLIMTADPMRDDALRIIGRVPNPCHTEAVDLDGDGRIDIVGANLGALLPGDHLKGSVFWLRRMAGGDYKQYTLASGLPRVADVQAVDVDGDGDLDLIVAAFGWREVGGIYWLENRTKNWDEPVFVKHELDARPGAIHVPVVDLNGDHKPDFVALISQQFETVVAFLGDGHGGFRKETIDQAPHPAWGSSGLEVVDMDGDGDLDVLVTNGDMLDDFRLKPYHGIRWLENRGSYPFVAHDIANLPGVHRARAVDLDGDGDLDVVACAFVQFSVNSAPPRSLPDMPSLVWLEQTTPGHFERHTLERGQRHVSLDVGDIDGDGRPDIVVGNFFSKTGAWVDVWQNRGAKK